MRKHLVPDRIVTEINSAPCRAAFSLLEVVLAMGIFFASLAILSQVTWNGTRAAVQSRLKAQAIFRCEAKIHELVAGVLPLSDQANVPFEDDSTWTWSVVTQPTDLPDLLLVEVTVSRESNGSLASASQTLRRWIRDPNVFIRAADEKAALEQERASASGGDGL